MTGNKVNLVQQLKQEMMEVFEMTNLRMMSYSLGMEIHQNEYEALLAKRSILKRLEEIQS